MRSLSLRGAVPGRGRAAPLLAALLALAISWPALRNGWVGYDEGFYARAQNLLLLSLAPANLLRLIASAGPSYQHQPVTALSYACDQALWGDQAPLGFHAHDLLLYAALTALVALFAQRVARDLPPLRAHAGEAAFAAGAVFAAHPVHVESYAWIADRKDLLSTLLALAALLLARRARSSEATGRRGVLLVGLALVVFLLSLGAKVAALGLGVLVGLDAWSERPRPLRARVAVAVRAGLPFLVLGLGVALVWLAAQRGFPVPLGSDAPQTPLWHRLLYPLRCLGAQVRALVWPCGLTIHYLPGASTSAWAADLGPLVGAGLGLWLAIRVGGAIRSLALLAGAWLVVGLAPTLNVVPLGYVNDRYLLWPSVGVAAAAGGAFALARAARPRLTLSLGLAGLGLLIALSVGRIHDFRDARSLWGAQVREQPASPYGYLGLCQAALAEGELREAREWLERARALNTGVPVVAAVEEALLRREGALAAADAVLAARSDPAADLERAKQALARGEPAEARRLVGRVLQVWPRHADAQLLAGKLLLSQGDAAGALALLEPAALHTGGADHTYHAALAAFAAGDPARAALHLEVLERAGPSWRSRLLAARIARARGDLAGALRALSEARALLGAPPEGWDEVGVSYAVLGALEPAAELLARAVEAGGGAAVIYDLARVEALRGRSAAARERLAAALAADPSLRERARHDPALGGLR